MPYCHACSTMELSILSQFILIDVDHWIHWHNVKSAVTSEEVKCSPSYSTMFFICCTKPLVFWTWQGDFPMSDLNILACSLSTPYVTIPLLETIGLRGMSILWIFGNPWNLGEPILPIGYILL